MSLRKLSVPNVIRPGERVLSWAYDALSFLPINLLQLRHGLPLDFASAFSAYVDQHRTVSFADFYAAPPWSGPELPEAGRIRFDSPFPGPFPENNQATFDLFPCSQGWTQPTMLLAHGLMSVSDRGYRLWARTLNARGWNAVFCHLPYHYTRTPWRRWGGELAVTADLIRVVEGVRQAVVEARMLIDALGRKGVPYCGVWGTSYGGWVSALLCACEPQVKRALLVEPIVNIESAIWRSPATIGLRHVLRGRRVTPEHTRPHLRLCCPSQARPLLSTSDIIFVAGEYDGIARPAEIRALHEAWAGSKFVIAPQGHVGYTLMPRSFQLAQEQWPDEFAKEREGQVLDDVALTSM